MRAGESLRGGKQPPPNPQCALPAISQQMSGRFTKCPTPRPARLCAGARPDMTHDPEGVSEGVTMQTGPVSQPRGMGDSLGANWGWGGS